jgi:hypothetical protein
MDTTKTLVDSTRRTRAADEADLGSAEACHPDPLDPTDKPTLNVERAGALAWMLNQLCWERRIDDLRAARTTEADQVAARTRRET